MHYPIRKSPLSTAGGKWQRDNVRYGPWQARSRTWCKQLMTAQVGALLILYGALLGKARV
jgi:hypothetical protein